MVTKRPPAADARRPPGPAGGDGRQGDRDDGQGREPHPRERSGVRDGREVGHELPARDPDLELPAHHPAGREPVVERVVVQHHARAGALGLEHGQVRVPHQTDRVHDVARLPHGDAERQRGPQHVVDLWLEVRAQAPGQLEQLLGGTGPLDDDEELVPAVPRGGRPGRGPGLEVLGGEHEHAVTPRVSVDVVDVLEAVDVDEDHRDAGALDIRRLDDGAQSAVHGGAVGQARQRVGVCGVAQAPGHRLALRGPGHRPGEVAQEGPLVVVGLATVRRAELDDVAFPGERSQRTLQPRVAEDPAGLLAGPLQQCLGSPGQPGVVGHGGERVPHGAAPDAGATQAGEADDREHLEPDRERHHPGAAQELGREARRLQGGQHQQEAGQGARPGNDRTQRGLPATPQGAGEVRGHEEERAQGQERVDDAVGRQVAGPGRDHHEVRGQRQRDPAGEPRRQGQQRRQQGRTGGVGPDRREGEDEGGPEGQVPGDEEALDEDRVHGHVHQAVDQAQDPEGERPPQRVTCAGPAVGAAPPARVQCCSAQKSPGQQEGGEGVEQREGSTHVGSIGREEGPLERAAGAISS